MANITINLDGKKKQISVLFPKDILNMLPASLVLDMVSPYINHKGLQATKPCNGYYLLYRKSVVVGNMLLAT